MSIEIRQAVESDSEQIFPLMKELAIFEHYIDSFAITPEIVRKKGFQKEPPDFYCLVAEDCEMGKIAGMLVYYYLPYTAQNSSDIYMKELFVDEAYRSKGVGRMLMLSLQQEAKEKNCSQIKWTVAPWNDAGKRFYENLGAQENHYEWNITD
jgi:ribosomal protein S18 acetylase RimI-like enzyme